jgi:DNA topoisomerase VI subunit B
MAPTQIEVVDWFAQREEDSYRDEARNILDSYAHPWDILAELAQNAVDAIDSKRGELGQPFEGVIEIEVDQEARSVRFRDNGTGIGDEDLRRVLKPHFSRKRGRSLRGEKGVGLTYIALTGNQFEILTKTKGETRKLTVAGSQEWIRECELPHGKRTRR